MALSRLATQFAAEIAMHDWSDAPFRADRAGHRRERDSNAYGTAQLDPVQTECVKVNAMWVAAQVLAYNDPNFDVNEFAGACGFREFTVSGRRWGGTFVTGLRGTSGGWMEPGSPLP
ncbi:hypothetical protein ACFY36_49040 [Actinoplanes sp. NPDC000266]